MGLLKLEKYKDGILKIQKPNHFETMWTEKPRNTAIKLSREKIRKYEWPAKEKKKRTRDIYLRNLKLLLFPALRSRTKKNGGASKENTQYYRAKDFSFQWRVLHIFVQFLPGH